MLGQPSSTHNLERVILSRESKMPPVMRSYVERAFPKCLLEVLLLRWPARWRFFNFALKLRESGFSQVAVVDTDDELHEVSFRAHVTEKRLDLTGDNL